MNCEKKGLQEVLRDFVIALSVANLWFFHVWRVLLVRHPNSYPYYHWKANPAPILLATMLDVLMLAGLLWLAISFTRHSKRPLLLKIAREALLLMFLVAVADVMVFILIGLPLRRGIRTLVDHLGQLFPSLGVATIQTWLWILAALLALVLSTLLIHELVYSRKRLIKLAVILLLIISPFVLLTFSQAAWQWTKYRSGSQFQDNTAAAIPQPSNSEKRILWIVFDELDYRLSFEDRAPEVTLPEFDRLRQESIFASNAYPPSGDTILSLPALITGRLVSQSTRHAPNELMLTFAGNDEAVPWSSQSNVFSSARAMGFNSALVGWYHPYCRVIGRSLTKCSWAGGLGLLNDPVIAKLSREAEVTLVKSMLQLAVNSLVPSVVRILRGTDKVNLWRISTSEQYVSIHQQSLAMAADPDLDLVMIHYPIPHPPGIYSRFTHAFSLERTSSYLDNLELADRTLGELRKKMEDKGLWENTTVLISSDHSLRGSRIWQDHPMWGQESPRVRNSVGDERVPFILKVAGQKRSLTYEKEFNTVLSNDLLLAFLSGEVLDGEAFLKWLDQHRSIGESPYIEAEK